MDKCPLAVMRKAVEDDDDGVATVRVDRRAKVKISALFRTADP